MARCKARMSDRTNSIGIKFCVLVCCFQTENVGETHGAHSLHSCMGLATQSAVAVAVAVAELANESIRCTFEENPSTTSICLIIWKKTREIIGNGTIATVFWIEFWIEFHFGLRNVGKKKNGIGDSSVDIGDNYNYNYTVGCSKKR